MGLVSALIGGSCGFACQCFSNSIKKVPLSRQPWMHVFMFTAGGWVGHKYPQWERELVDDINQVRSSKGLPSMVGTSAWIRYSTGDDDAATPFPGKTK